MVSPKQPMLLRGKTSPLGSPAPESVRRDSEPVEEMRVLHVAFACHPHQSMETRIGWNRAVHAARQHEVTVLHGSPENESLLASEAARLGLGDRLRFVAIDRCWMSRLFNRTATTYYLGYRFWHACALQKARELHAEQPFDLVHQTTYCGFREPGDGWRLGVPFVWGPVGGTQAFPTAYLTQLGPRGAWIELCRNVINAWQLRFSGRVRRATREAAVLVAATQKAADDIERTSGRRAPVQLETGLGTPAGPPREPRHADEPFKILWAGRLRAWKTLPLLLKALPLLPTDVDWRLRVLGVGACKSEWLRLAKRLEIEDRIEWAGWPTYQETLPHYAWADAFAFTSMRDTSGTGLLESLAAGTPIVGVDHQGAADIMTPECAVPVPVGAPHDTINGFATALTTLARDPSLWQSLSDGARREAEHHAWENQADELLDWYAEAHRTATQPAVEPATIKNVPIAPAASFARPSKQSPATG